MKSEWQKKRSFGPVVEIKNGSLRAHCTWCAFRVGDTCTHVRPSRRIPDPENTPEWCEMRDETLNEAEKMARKWGDIP